MRQVPGCPLWLGHVGDARDLRAVLSAGIVAVVDLALNEPPVAVTRELVYLRFPLVDGPGNAPWLLRAAVSAVAELLSCGVPALVFCSNGLSRSLCVAGAAVALARGCPPDQGLEIVSSGRPADVLPGLWAEVRTIIPIAEGE